MSCSGRQNFRWLGIRATPRAFENRVDCLAEHGPDSAECNLPRSATLADENPAAGLAEELASLTVVDLTDWLCDETSCPAVTRTPSSTTTGTT